jgi:CubicO group peptidase (beta-lactamase class C family)
MMRTARFVATLVFVFSSAVQLVAQTKPAADSSQKTGDQEARIHRVVATLVDLPMGEGQARLRMDLLQLMKLYNVPGLSVAVIDDYKIIWAEGYGVIETGSSTPVTPKTLFQAGSISKPVAATGALYLVEHGKLALDENVNEKLKTWKVPDNEFTKNEKVTLRRLMSHTAGLTIHGFPGYDLNDAMPTLVQIFNGEKPANTEPIRVDTVPGTIERYSGGGVTIEQQLMMDVSGKAFPALMRELVLDKIGMAESSYEQPLPPARAAVTASGTYSDGKVVHGRWHIYPEMAAAGLWTTPTDLCRFAIEIAQSKQGKSNRVLSEKMTKEMLTPVLEEAGLGLFMEKINPGQFGHNGADEGFQAILTMNAESGKGLAIMANSDNGITVGDVLLRKIAKEYGWNYKFSDPPGMEAAHMLVLVAKVKNVQAALQRYAELKKTPAADYTIAEQTLNTVGYVLLYSGQEQEAITVFQRNVEDYPQSGNVYDSLGEAYMKTGQKELAIQKYEKSLQLDPKNKNAVEMLKKLREMK